MSVERLRSSDKTISIETIAHDPYANLLNTLRQLFEVGFSGAAGVTYMDHKADLSQDLINLSVKQSASATANSQEVEDLKPALRLGAECTIGKVMYTIFGNQANKPASDPNWAGTAKKFANQVAVSKRYTDTLSQIADDITTLNSVMAAVSNTSDVSSDEAIASLSGVALLSGPGSC